MAKVIPINRGVTEEINKIEAAIQKTQKGIDAINKTRRNTTGPLPAHTEQLFEHLVCARDALKKQKAKIEKAHKHQKF